MEVLLTARVLDVGEYDLTNDDGSHPRFLDVYDKESGQIRLSLHKECVVPAGVEFGTICTLGCLLDNSEKYVRGEERDRSIKGVRLRVRDIAIAAAKNGSTRPARVEVAA